MISSILSAQILEILSIGASCQSRGHCWATEYSVCLAVNHPANYIQANWNTDERWCSGLWSIKLLPFRPKMSDTGVEVTNKMLRTKPNASPRGTLIVWHFVGSYRANALPPVLCIVGTVASLVGAFDWIINAHLMHLHATDDSCVEMMGTIKNTLFGLCRSVSIAKEARKIFYLINIRQDCFVVIN